MIYIQVYVYTYRHMYVYMHTCMYMFVRLYTEAFSCAAKDAHGVKRKAEQSLEDILAAAENL